MSKYCSFKFKVSSFKFKVSKEEEVALLVSFGRGLKSMSWMPRRL